MLETQLNYPINSNFEEQINTFFTDLSLAPVKVELTILDNRDYDKATGTISTVEFHKTGAENAKARTLIEETSDKGYRIYVRKFENTIDLTSIMRSYLQAYFPIATKEAVDKATHTFESAYRCYNQLFYQKPLRDFFIQLCREDQSIFTIADLRPK